MAQKKARHEGPDPDEMLKVLRHKRGRLQQQSVNLSLLLGRHEHYSSLGDVKNENDATMLQLEGGREVRSMDVLAERDRLDRGVINQGTVEYYRGTKRKSIVIPMSTLERSVVFNLENNEEYTDYEGGGGGEGEKGEDDEEDEEGYGDGYRNGEDDDNYENNNDTLESSRYENMAASRVRSTNSRAPSHHTSLSDGTILNLPKNGDEALRQFLVTRKATAFRKDAELRTKINVFDILKEHAHAKANEQKYLLEAVAHVQVSQAQRALRRWALRAKAWARDRELREKSRDFFRSKNAPRGFELWREYIEEQRKVEKAAHLRRSHLITSHFGFLKAYRLEALQARRNNLTAYAHSVMKLCHYSVRAWRRRVAYWKEKRSKQSKADRFLARTSILRWRAFLTEERKIRAAQEIYCSALTRRSFNLWIELVSEAHKFNFAAKYSDKKVLLNALGAWKEVRTGKIERSKALLRNKSNQRMQLLS